MAVSLEQFVQHLTIVAYSRPLRSLRFKTACRRRDLRTPKSLARELVHANKLTKYQAASGLPGEDQRAGFGEYRVLDKLGQGGMGVVLKAEHRRMKRLVAVKTIAGAAMKSPDAVKRFYREVEAAAKLNHPNIVQPTMRANTRACTIW